MARTKQTVRKSTGGKAPRKTVSNDSIKIKKVKAKKYKCIGCDRQTNGSSHDNLQFVCEKVCRRCVRSMLENIPGDTSSEDETDDDDDDADNNDGESEVAFVQEEAEPEAEAEAEDVEAEEGASIGVESDDDEA